MIIYLRHIVQGHWLDRIHFQNEKYAGLGSKIHPIMGFPFNQLNELIINLTLLVRFLWMWCWSTLSNSIKNHSNKKGFILISDKLSRRFWEEHFGAGFFPIGQRKIESGVFHRLPISYQLSFTHFIFVQNRFVTQNYSGPSAPIMVAMVYDRKRAESSGSYLCTFLWFEIGRQKIKFF